MHLLKSKQPNWNPEEYRTRTEAYIRKAWPDDPIDLEELIFHREPSASSDCKQKLTIFIDRALDLDYLVDPESTSEAEGELSKIAVTGSIPCKHLCRDEQIAFRQMLGAAVQCATSGNITEAEHQRIAAKEFIDRRIMERSRLWSLEYAFYGLIAILGIAAIMRILESVQIVSSWSMLAQSALLGYLGAYVSMVYEGSKGRRDSSSGRWLHFVEILSKYCVGTVAGALSCLILTSHLAPQVFQSGQIDSNAIGVLGFIAGFSEKFIPRMVSTYEKQPIINK